MRGNDVEPVELEPLDVDDRRPPRAPLHLSRRWVVVIAVVVVAWIGIVVATRNGNHAAKTTTATTPLTLAPTPETLAGGFVGTELPSTFVNRLSDVGPRFVVSTGDELFVVVGSHQARVALPPGRLNIEAQSGDAVLVQLDDASAIVTTNPVAVHAIPRDRFVIPAVEPGHWWYVRNDHLLQKDGAGGMRFPPNLRILAAVETGFVAFDSVKQQYVIWNETVTRPLIRDDSAFLGASPRQIAFARGCSAFGCTLEVENLSGGVKLTRFSHDVYRSAVFSRSGTKLAAIDTFGRITVVDVATGGQSFNGPSVGVLATGMPATWAGERLLVVQHFDVEVVDGVRLGTLPIDGLQQVVALR